MSVLDQKLIFVHGKGGTGRTTVAAGLGFAFAARGERVLVVQWALGDAIGPAIGMEPVGHRAVEVAPNFSTMNFDAEEALREYVVEYMGMPRLFHLVLENRQMRRLIRALPGLAELLFVGRLYYLVQLAARSGRRSWDRVIVDAPATGHGVSLVATPRMVKSIGFAGPLANESERVLELLNDRSLTADVVVTLPEELVVDETLELIPALQEASGRPVNLVVLNRSVSHLLGHHEAEPPWLGSACGLLSDRKNAPHLRAFWHDVNRRAVFEQGLRQRLGEGGLVPLATVQDFLFLSANLCPGVCFRFVSEVLDEFLTQGRRHGTL